MQGRLECDIWALAATQFNESITSWKKALVFILIDGEDRLDFVWDAFQITLSGDDRPLMPTLTIITAQL